MNVKPNIRTVKETPTSVVIDGDGTLGYLPMVMATEGAIAKAKQVGIGMGLVRHIGHYGSAGHYARMAWRKGVSASRCRAIATKVAMAMMAAALIPMRTSAISAIHPFVSPFPARRSARGLGCGDLYLGGLSARP